jgi:extracellular elastinolytic metalloproteinase
MALLQRALAVSALALATLPLTQAQGVRKSLSFKQPLPNAQFNANPPSISTHGYKDAHPHDIARLFLDEHLLATGTSYYIRSDSYTDVNTGISHVYVRQLVNGLEVADGDINLNIRDGQVLSYGNSVNISLKYS